MSDFKDRLKAYVHWNMMNARLLNPKIDEDKRFLVEDIDKLLERTEGLEAARVAYAKEFPLKDGEPDVGSVHENIRKLKAEKVKLRELVDKVGNWLTALGPHIDNEAMQEGNDNFIQFVEDVFEETK